MTTRSERQPLGGGARHDADDRFDRYPDVVAANTSIPWSSMRGMRNRIAHGYFAIDMALIWGDGDHAAAGSC